MTGDTNQGLDILVIEQEADAREALVSGLQGAGHHIMPFADAAEFIRAEKPAVYDLAFIGEEAGGGRGTLSRLRQHCPHMRVVLTGSTGQPGMEREEVLGCVGRPV